MAFLPGYASTLSHFDLLRYTQKTEVCKCDPYDLLFDDLSEDNEAWPGVTDVDRIDYLVFRTNFTTKDAMKNFKSLDAHNFFTSGLVFPPRSKEISDDRVLLLGMVHHSQRHTLKPLKLWMLVEKGGCIVTGHCSCMAGRGETCSHIAATIYLLEFAAKAKDARTCTDKQCAWLPPTMSAVPAKEIRDIDFTSAKGRLKKIEALVEAGEVNCTPPVRATPQSLPIECVVSEQWRKDFLSELTEANPIAVGLSCYRDLCSPFKNAPSSPLDLTKLYDHNSLDLPFAELLEKCKAIMNGMKISKAEIDTIKEKQKIRVIVLLGICIDVEESPEA